MKPLVLKNGIACLAALALLLGSCRGKTAMSDRAGAGSDAGNPRRSDIDHYTCPMHPDVRSATQAKCPLCGMDLTPVEREEAESGTIHVDETVRELLSIQSVPVQKRRVVKNVVMVGRVLARDKADLRAARVEADLYDRDIPPVRVGQKTQVSLQEMPGKALDFFYGLGPVSLGIIPLRSTPVRVFEGKVDYLYPSPSEEERARRVRIAVADPGALLKPGQFVHAAYRVDLGVRRMVPVDAVIFSGPRRYVFVDRGEGRLAPREIRVGVRSRDEFEVAEGLADDETVVAYGAFLIAAESRLKTGFDSGSAESSGPTHTH